MATLTQQLIKRAGITPTYAAASVGGDRFAPGADVFLHVKNAGGSPVTVTIAVTEKVQGDIVVSNVAVTVNNGSEKMIGPFPLREFLATDGSGLCDVTYSAVTSLTIAAVQIAQP